MSYTLLTAEWAKERFPAWSKFCDVEEFEGTADDLFDIAMGMAEVEFLEYLDVSVSTITDPMKRHLLNIVKKVCFNFRQDDAQFEQAPQIVVDYERTIAKLTAWRDGEPTEAPAPDANADTVTMASKDRMFETWFTDHVDDLASTE